VTAAAWVSNASHIWLDQGSNGVNFQTSPQRTNCIRCHTSQGLIQFLDSGFTNIDQIKMNGTNTGASVKLSVPLACNACHIPTGYGTGQADIPEGKLRTASFGTTGYKAFWGYSNATYLPKKIVTSIQLMSNKNSDICMPCHSQRASGQEVKDYYAAATALDASNAVNVGTSIYPHEGQPAAIWNGVGGYDFTATNGTGTSNGFAYQDRARHQRIGNYGTSSTGYNGTGITQGSCVGCHFTSPKSIGNQPSHTLEIVKNGQIISTECVLCHPSNFTAADLDAKYAEQQALVKALGNLLISKGITQNGTTVLAERKSPFDMSLGTGDKSIAEKNTGAWFNWYLGNTADKAAYAHNPSYIRRLLTDAIDYLDDGVLNNSSATAIYKNVSTGAGRLTTDQINNAVAFTQDPGCLGCHFGTGLNGEAPGIQGAPHYNTTGALVPDETFTQAQFVVPGTQCNYCHGFGHGTDSPGGTILAEYAESGHGDINSIAWAETDFKTRSNCNVCHSTAGFVKFAGQGFAGSNAGVAADGGYKQILGCNACHSSTAWEDSVRTMSGGYVAGQGGLGSAAVANINMPDVGESNICIPCHAGRQNGASLIATATPGSSAVTAHYLAAAAVFYGNGGFQYYTSGVRYNTYGAAGKVGKNANWSHGRLGMENYSSSGNNDLAGKSNNTGSDGQCVACHLGPTNTHSFSAAEVADATMAGATNLVNGKPMTRTCFGCHKGNEDSAAPTIEAFIEEEKVIWDRMFDFYTWQLAQYGIYFVNNGFYTDSTAATRFTNWPVTVGTTFGGSGASDFQKTMGTAMNLHLLVNEKGSHVHNRAFGRALIADSMTWLQKGDMGSYTQTFPDRNDVIKFTAYSSAVSAGGAYASTGVFSSQFADGAPVSITTLKSYLTRGSAGAYTRR
jgi:hypothetical protein